MSQSGYDTGKYWLRKNWEGRAPARLRTQRPAPLPGKGRRLHALDEPTLVPPRAMWEGRAPARLWRRGLRRSRRGHRNPSFNVTAGTHNYEQATATMRNGSMCATTPSAKGLLLQLINGRIGASSTSSCGSRRAGRAQIESGEGRRIAVRRSIRPPSPRHTTASRPYWTELFGCSLIWQNTLV